MEYDVGSHFNNQNRNGNFSPRDASANQIQIVTFAC